LESAAAPGDADGGVGDDDDDGGGDGGEVADDEGSLCSTDSVVRVPCARMRSLSIAVCVGGVDVEHNVVCSCASESAIALGSPPRRSFFFDFFILILAQHFSTKPNKIK